MGARGIGLGQHPADELRLGQHPEQGSQQPALAHQLFEGGPAGPGQGGLLGQALVVEGALGAVDQHHLAWRLPALAQQAGGGEGHHAADGVAYQMEALQAWRVEGPGQIGHELSPEVEAVAYGACPGGLPRQTGRGLVAGPETQQIHGQHLGITSQGRHGVAPVAAGGAKAMHQQHPVGSCWITRPQNTDAVAPPGPDLGRDLAQTVAFWLSRSCLSLASSPAQRGSGASLFT